MAEQSTFEAMTRVITKPLDDRIRALTAEVERLRADADAAREEFGLLCRELGAEKVANLASCSHMVSFLGGVILGLGLKVEAEKAVYAELLEAQKAVYAELLEAARLVLDEIPSHGLALPRFAEAVERAEREGNARA